MLLNRSLGIASKLTLLALGFAVPTAYLLWLLVSQQQIAIAFATKEAAGARTLAALLPVQVAAGQAALGGKEPAEIGRLMQRVAQEAQVLGAGEAVEDAARVLAAAHDGAALAAAQSPVARSDGGCWGSLQPGARQCVG